MKKVILSILAAAPLMVGGATSALSQVAADPYGYQAIMAGDFATAEKRLIRERLIHPKEPSVLLNLAYVYAATGRTTEAVTHYRRALMAENVLMELPGSDTPGWSHDIAKKGLARTPAMASR